MFKILFLGDIVGKLGRCALQAFLPGYKAEQQIDIVIANVENLSHGAGITQTAMQEIERAGVDAFTSGNHVWDNPNGVALFEDPKWKDRLVRPANLRRQDPGQGFIRLPINNRKDLCLINLSGQLGMHEQGPIENPFHTLDTLLESRAHERTPITIVDLHAEYTSEKEALGHYADGRVAAILGTHTHIQTSDAKLLPNGTAYCTDVGRVGSHHSVLGFEKNSAIKRFLSNSNTPYELERSGEAEICGVLLDIEEETCQATSIRAIRELIVV
ncbi:metallophosphoesterase [Candidatus Uhrbacteria bacterium]|nr:metallophosphoesterase [Candidatus Uhrbacteria bacterium]MBD3284018.1 metallophosphoesterase [Candidatus Uhrbacteria bacterium]